MEFGEKMKTVIMAGGRGTRISSIAPNIPKPMIKIQGKPVLEYEIECLRRQGFIDIIVSVSHLAEYIIEYFGDGEKFGVHMEYYYEEDPIGNAGAIFKVKDRLTEDFLLLNADSIFDVDFNKFVQFHKNHNAMVTVFTHPNAHPYDSSLVIADQENRVERWLTKEDAKPKFYKNRVNAGLHVISPEIFQYVKIEEELIGKKDSNGEIIKVDLDRQILKPLAGTGKMFCYNSPEYVKDMGTPERYQKVCADFKEGRVQAKNLRYKQKAIFLDRDGTINQYKGFIKEAADFDLLPRVAEAIQFINESGYLAIVVTNQPVIARGETTVHGLMEIHNKMETLLGREGAYLDQIYMCPHHPDRGYPGEILELKISCNCRKPKPGMLYKASKDFNIDLLQSWVIGDSQNDIVAGMAAGCKTALIGAGTYGQDLTVNSLLEGVQSILYVT